MLQPGHAGGGGFRKRLLCVFSVFIMLRIRQAASQNIVSVFAWVSRSGISTPYGSVENPINPIPMAIGGGATYVARAFSGKQRHMVVMIKGAIQHKGFALVDVFSPCVTYNKENTSRSHGDLRIFSEGFRIFF
jgi:hypothetical protein